jgi:serine/threonine-protein kinase RsbW
MTESASTSTGELRVFEARMSMLPETAAFVEAFCARRGIAREDALRLVLIVEELFTNTVAHGYGRECGAPISIALGTDGGQVTLGYEDAAPPYDPLATLDGSRAGLAHPVESRHVGRLGVHLVDELPRRALCARRRAQSSLADGATSRLKRHE